MDSVPSKPCPETEQTDLCELLVSPSTVRETILEHAVLVPKHHQDPNNSEPIEQGDIPGEDNRSSSDAHGV